MKFLQTNNRHMNLTRYVTEIVMILAMIMFAMGVQQAKAQGNTEAWSVRCNAESNDPAHRCEMFQRLVEKESGKRFAEFAIGFPEGKNVARGAIVLPLGILLHEGNTMQIDDGPVFSFRVRYCMTDGCYAFIDLNDQVLAEMKKGLKAKLSLKSYQGTSMVVPVSLVGFTKALRDVKK